MLLMRRRQLQNSPNDLCLREMVEHIIYEIDGFRKGFDKWQQLNGRENASDCVAFNKVVEVALLHYRTLLEFFRSHPLEVSVDDNLSTDIVATDYLCSSASDELRSQAEELCRSYKTRIDQQLCHISTGVVRPISGESGRLE